MRFKLIVYTHCCKIVLMFYNVPRIKIEADKKSKVVEFDHFKTKY